MLTLEPILDRNDSQGQTQTRHAARIRQRWTYFVGSRSGEGSYTFVQVDGTQMQHTSRACTLALCDRAYCHSSLKPTHPYCVYYYTSSNPPAGTVPYLLGRLHAR